MNNFTKGFKDEMEKAAYLGWLSLPAKNLLFHAIANTNIMPKARRAIISAGEEFAQVGVRHGLTGRRVSAAGAIPFALIDGGASHLAYNKGWGIGNKIREITQKVPLTSDEAPLKAFKLLDDAIKKSTTAAPIAGALGGASYGYLTAKTKKEPIPVKAIIANALVGALIGKGAKHFTPQAPIVKQIGQVRDVVVEPALKGSTSTLGKILDTIAR